MTTLRQTLANRRNASLSTGPRSPAGREAASRNALTHGMTAEEILHEDEETLIRTRLAEWLRDLRPVGAYQRWLAERVVAASARIDRCRLHEDAWLYRQARRAALCWDDDRRLDVERLAAGLDSKPALVALTLRQSLHGCDWLVTRWRRLGEGLRTDAGAGEGDRAGAGPIRPLDEDERRLACDLLGLDAVLRTGRTPLDPPQGSVLDAPAHQDALIAEQVAGLERHKAEVLAELDAMDRAAATLGLGPGVDPTLRLIRRYEAAAQKQMRQGLEELRKLQSAPGGAMPNLDEERDEDLSACAYPVPPGSSASPASPFPAAEAEPPPPVPAPRTLTASGLAHIAAAAPESPAPQVVASDAPAAVVANEEPHPALAPAHHNAAVSLPEAILDPASTPIITADRPPGLAEMFAADPLRNRRSRRALARKAAHRGYAPPAPIPHVPN